MLLAMAVETEWRMKTGYGLVSFYVALPVISCFAWLLLQLPSLRLIVEGTTVITAIATVSLAIVTFRHVSLTRRMVEDPLKAKAEEYCSLLTLFAQEAVLAYSRSVNYCIDFWTEKSVSKSTLYLLTDSTAFSRLTAVCDKPKLVAAILDMRSRFFQVERHANVASMHIAASDTSIVDGKDQLVRRRMELAYRSAHAAASFFHSSSKEQGTKEDFSIPKDLNLLLNELGKIAEDDEVAKETEAQLRKMFENAQGRYKKAVKGVFCSKQD